MSLYFVYHFFEIRYKIIAMNVCKLESGSNLRRKQKQRSNKIQNISRKHLPYVYVYKPSTYCCYCTLYRMQRADPKVNIFLFECFIRFTLEMWHAYVTRSYCNQFEKQTRIDKTEMVFSVKCEMLKSKEHVSLMDFWFDFFLLKILWNPMQYASEDNKNVLEWKFTTYLEVFEMISFWFRKIWLGIRDILIIFAF